MQITIFGGTGYVGKVLLAKALDSGYTVKVLVRDPAKLGEFRDRVEYVTGDAVEPDAVHTAIAGSAAVLSTIAPSKQKPGDPRIYEKTMKNIIDAMGKAGVTRLIHIGGAGYSVENDELWTLKRRFLRRVLKTFAGPILEAKRLEWQVLKASRLDWTLVRPPAIIASAPAGVLIADEKRLPEISVNLSDLADFMLNQISSSEWIRKAPLVSSCRKQPG